MTDYKLTYFDARGRAEPARMLFKLADVKYEDHRLKKGEWETLKPNTPFGGVPILEFEENQKKVILCQGHAIERYLARKFGLAGSSEVEHAQVDMLIGCTEETELQIAKFIYETDVDRKADLKKKLEEDTLPRQMGYFEKFLEKNKKNDVEGYFVGDTITAADIRFANMTTWIPPDFKFDLNAQFPELQKLVDRVFSQPKIAEWIANRPKSSF